MIKKQNNLLLTVEYIPSTCHFSNARTMLSSKDWNIVRKLTYELAGNKCEICGTKSKLEAHEIWNYNDETHEQKLVGLICLCSKCHLTKHIGRAIVMHKEDECYRHMRRINKWSLDEVKQHILTACEINKERSQHEWTLDISLLETPPYNLKIDSDKERVFKVKKYKRKKKKKKKLINKHPKRN